MIMICQILTDEPEGGSAMIPLWRFRQLYKFLANIDSGKSQRFRNGRRIIMRPDPNNPNGPMIEHLETPQGSFSSRSSSNGSEQVKETQVFNFYIYIYMSITILIPVCQ